MIELFDWYNQRGQLREAGFLVKSIKNPSSIQFPKGFRSAPQIKKSEPVSKERDRSRRSYETKREREGQKREETRLSAFMAFWKGLSPQAQFDFEGDAIDNADATKRAGYFRAQGEKGRLFEHYKTIILRDHFERTRK